MATASGQVTNAVFGFTSMLINLLRDHRPDGIAVAFDRPEPTFRHERIETYKANRTRRARHPPPADRPRPPGDRDACASRSSRCPASRPTTSSPRWPPGPATTERPVIVVTGDRDSYQLVEDPLVKVLYNRRGVSDYALYDEAGIEERTGVPPRPLRPVRRAAGRHLRQPARACPGVGEKTAAKLINTYGDLDGVFANLESQTPEAAGVARRQRGARPPQRPGHGAGARRTARRRPRVARLR